ncbi:MAG: Hsp20/alpha crystallin family protein [Gaiellaceae bacterium]
MRGRRYLKDDIDELFADLWQVSRISGLRRGFRPQVDSFRTEEPPSYTVLVDIAGIDPEKVNVTAVDGALFIGGERPREVCEGRVYHQIEIEHGPFERVVRLPEDADLRRAEARYDRGLLRIEIPIAAKAPAAEPVPIEIRRPA